MVEIKFTVDMAHHIVANEHSRDSKIGEDNLLEELGHCP